MTDRDWSSREGDLLQPIRSTTHIWIETRHQYGISALVSQTSFRGKTSGSVAKCRLFSQVTVYRHYHLTCQTQSNHCRKTGLCSSGGWGYRVRSWNLWPNDNHSFWIKTYKDTVRHVQILILCYKLGQNCWDNSTFFFLLRHTTISHKQKQKK